MIRPEAMTQIVRLRELLAALAVLALGLYWAVFTGGLLFWVGCVVALSGAVLAYLAIQRLRFHQGTDGPGIVQVVEGRITYFGPLSGGVVDIKDISRVTYDPRNTPAHWLLQQPGQPPLAIPVTAEGADSLFDAFASLPGLRTEKMLRDMDADSAIPIVIWSASPVRDPIARLH